MMVDQKHWHFLQTSSLSGADSVTNVKNLAQEQFGACMLRMVEKR
jgi:hypothetical protein